MIPKTIHYCWFGGKPKPELVLRCIESWKKYCPDYTIKEWNEGNFDVSANPFTKSMHSQKRWAFVADYVRLVTLENEGGIYLDTDMLLVQPLDPLLGDDIFLGEEDVGIISAGIIGATAHHPLIELFLDYYNTHPAQQITIPRVLTLVYEGYQDKTHVRVYPPQTFYPFSAEHIHKYKEQRLDADTYGVHLWNFSWGHPLNKFFKKTGIHKFGKSITEKIGIKNAIKKLLGFI